MLCWYLLWRGSKYFITYLLLMKEWCGFGLFSVFWETFPTFYFRIWTSAGFFSYWSLFSFYWLFYFFYSVTVEFETPKEITPFPIFYGCCSCSLSFCSDFLLLIVFNSILFSSFSADGEPKDTNEVSLSGTSILYSSDECF